MQRKEIIYNFPKLKIIENFVSPEECNWFIQYVEKQDLWKFSNAKKDYLADGKDFELVAKQWDNRKIDFNKLYWTKKHAELYKKIYPIMLSAKQEISTFFDVSTKNFQLESWEAVRWYYPYWQGPHLDYIDPNFDRKNYDIDMSFFSEDEEALYRRHCTTKHMTGMIYMNEDFEGGELYFPYHNNFELKPKPGMLVMFSGHAENPHGIKQITKGTRYVHTTFWCKDPKRLSIAKFPIGYIENYNSQYFDNYGYLNKYWE